METNIWKHGEMWWVPILLLCLGGIGWLIKNEIEQSKQLATIVGKVDPPPARVSLFMDGKKVTDSMESGWFRIDEVRPGEHEIKWEADGLNNSSIVTIKGGRQNRLDLPSLSIRFQDGEKVTDKNSELIVTTDIHKWFAGSRYHGEVYLSPNYPFTWHCSGGTCILEGPYGTGLNMEVCKLLVAKVGPLDYYYNDTGMTWSKAVGKEMLDNCNNPKTTE